MEQEKKVYHNKAYLEDRVHWISDLINVTYTYFVW